MSLTSPTFWLSGPSTSVPLNFEASHWSGFCDDTNCALPVVPVVGFMSAFGALAFGMSGISKGGAAGVDAGGDGARANAVPSANALTAEINASFLSIAGLLHQSFQEAIFRGQDRPPPAGETTRNRQPCSE